MADEAEAAAENVASADAGATGAEATPKEQAGKPEAEGKEPTVSKGGSIAAGGAEADTVAGGESDEPAEPDWRAAAAGDDKDLLRLAKRYGSVGGMLRSLAETKKQLSKGAGAFVDHVPEDATDEQKAAWRKARGVPESHDKYDIAVADAEWNDDAKKDIGVFTEEAHALGVPQKHVSLALQHFARVAAAKEQQLLEDGAAFAAQSQKALKQEYGRDYDRNTKLMEQYGHSRIGEDDYHDLMTKRFADGTVLGDDPRMAHLMIDMALEHADGLPFESGDAAGGVSDADLIKAHQALAAKSHGSGQEAKEARRKMNDPEYAAKIEAAYDRQLRRAGRAGKQAA